MKKILLLFTLLLAFAAPSMADPTFYVGGLKGSYTFQYSDEQFTLMTLLDGTTDTYYADFKPSAGGYWFCLGDGKGNDHNDFKANHQLALGQGDKECSGGIYSEQLSKPGYERNLKLQADGETTYRIMIVASTLKLTVTKVGLNFLLAGCYMEEGSNEVASFFGTVWDNTNTDNLLTLQTDGTYAKSFSGVELPTGNIKYKILQNGDWDALGGDKIIPSEGTISAGTYDITFKLWIDNPSGHQCILTDMTPHTYTVAGEPATFFGTESTWDVSETSNNDMTETSTGIYTWTKQIFAYNGSDINFKVAVDHDWTTSYPENNYVINKNHAGYEGAGNYNLTITYKKSDNSVIATLERIYPTINSVVISSGAISYELTGTNNVYEYDNIDFSAITTDIPFALLVNGTALSYDNVTIDEASASLLEAGTGDYAGYFIFKNSTSGYKTYKATATWTPNDDVTSGWTLKVVGKEVRLPGTTFWSSETPHDMGNWSGTNAVILGSDKFEKVKPGDILHVAVKVDNAGSAWDAQVSLRKNIENWPAEFAEAITVGDGTVPYASFVITGDMLKVAKESGMVVFGCNYSTDLITLESGVYADASDYSVWVGNKELGWTQATAGGYHFKNADVKEGQAIRLTYELSEGKTTDNIEIHLLSGWGENDVYGKAKKYDGTIPYNETSAVLSITDDMINTLKDKGLIVNANGIIISQIEVVPFTGYYLVGGTSSGWTDATEMDVNEGVYSASIDYSSNYEFAIAPNTAMNSNNTLVIDWNAVIRPESQTQVKFVSISGTGATGGSQNWKMKELTENESLAFTSVLTYTPNTKAWTIESSTEVDINAAAGYATYSNSQKFEVAEGPDIYLVTDADPSIVLTEPTSRILPGDRTSAIILKKDGGGKVTINSVAADAACASVEGNMLYGSSDWSYGLSGYNGGGTIYLLANGKHGVGFYQWDSTDNTPLAAHKAFLPVPATSREFLGFGEEGGTTGVEELKYSNTEDLKSYFNLAGQRVAQPTKGLYIVNGRKVVIK